MRERKEEEGEGRKERTGVRREGGGRGVRRRGDGSERKRRGRKRMRGGGKRREQ